MSPGVTNCSRSLLCASQPVLLSTASTAWLPWLVAGPLLLRCAGALPPAYLLLCVCCAGGR